MTVSITKVQKQYEKLVALLKERGLTLSAMESCTGGLVSSLITDVSGSSEVFPGGFVTYSNAAKVMQHVSAEVIRKYGVYSEETAVSMARAAAFTMNTELGIGITGSAGRKDPANADSVPGKVCIGIYWKNAPDDAEERTVSGSLTVVPGDDVPAGRRKIKMTAAFETACLVCKMLENQ